MITILLADDHRSILKSLQYFLDAVEDIQVVATASNGVEAVAEAVKHYVDVAVLDIAMPLMDGIEAARQMRELCPQTRVMMISFLDQPHFVKRALEVGAVGFVLKDALGSDLLPAIRLLSMGKRYFSDKIARIAELYAKRTGSDSWAG